MIKNQELMNRDEYVCFAMRTAKPLPTPPDHLLHAGLGVMSEAGELAGALSRHWTGQPQDDGLPSLEAALITECGDMLWFLALLAYTLHAEAVSRHLPAHTLDDHYDEYLLKAPSPGDAWFSADILRHELDEKFPEWPSSLSQEHSQSKFLPLVVDSAGRLGTLIKKEVIYGKPVDLRDYWFALIDCWVAVEQYAWHSLRITFDELARHNLDKLRKRYPDKFTDELAQLRLDTTG